MGVVVRRYIDILIIIITFPYSTCISSIFGSSIPTSLFIFKKFFRSCIILIKLQRFEIILLLLSSLWLSHVCVFMCVCVCMCMCACLFVVFCLHVHLDPEI